MRRGLEMCQNIKIMCVYSDDVNMRLQREAKRMCFSLSGKPIYGLCDLQSKEKWWEDCQRQVCEQIADETGRACLV